MWTSNLENPFFNQAEICKSSGLQLEANMCNEIGEYYVKEGKEKTALALNACIDKSKHEVEAWNRMFFMDLLHLIF